MAPRLYPGDEELGKRDDDHKPGTKPPLLTVWHYRRLHFRRSGKKIGLLLLAVIALYYFVKNIPTDLQRPTSLRPSYPPNTSGQLKSRPIPKTTAPSHKGGHGGHSTKADKKEQKGEHWFNGPIKFYELAASLHAISATGGAMADNRNVLFAASSLQSASILLPVACEMAKWKRNDVHFAFMGRDDISMDILKSINGVTKECDIWLHDARPDYSIESSDYRMEVSSSAALGHINNFMHPQAVIIDNSGAENPYFLTGMRDRSSLLGKTLIYLPPNPEQHLMWIARLDSASLNAFNKVSIDIMIHAQPSASGSLIRLLQSIAKADYFNSAPPRLTIELPSKVDEATMRFLSESFTWPPSNYPVEGNSRQITLHHRIPQSPLTSLESSVRFLESFWPINPSDSHVLILSPQAELSPVYYHYLKYTILEYKYSTVAISKSQIKSHQSVLGISLDLPTTYLNDTTNFTPPSKEPYELDSNTVVPTSFVWQAPNSNACLYFGDMWTEFHSFMSLLLLSKSSTKELSPDVATTHPAWLQPLLTFSRARGFTTMYPLLADDDALVTLHSELYHLPEEYAKRPRPLPDDDMPAAKGDELSADPEKHLSLQHAEKPLAKASLLNILPPDQLLQPLENMTILTWDGLEMDRSQLVDRAQSFSEEFRAKVGKCTVAIKGKLLDEKVEELFCLDSEPQAAPESETVKPAVSKESKVEEVAETAVRKETAADAINPKGKPAVSIKGEKAKVRAKEKAKKESSVHE